MSRTRVPDLGSRVKLTVSGMSVNGTTVSPWARPGSELGLQYFPTGNSLGHDRPSRLHETGSGRSPLFHPWRSTRISAQENWSNRRSEFCDYNRNSETPLQTGRDFRLHPWLHSVQFSLRLRVFVVKEGPNPPRRREESRRVFDQLWNSWPRFFGVDATWALQGAVQRSQTACPAAKPEAQAH